MKTFCHADSDNGMKKSTKQRKNIKKWKMFCQSLYFEHTDFTVIYQ
jgi:hypothetical protein